MDRFSRATPELEHGRRENFTEMNYQEPRTPVRPTDAPSTKYLDGLRGVAAFLVYMAHHVPWWYGVGNNLEHGLGYHGEFHFGQIFFIRSFFTGGNAAVAIFFVLSGYVLSISPLRMLRNKKRKECYRGLVSASIRRPIRLFLPPIGVSLIFALIMQLPFGLSPQLAWPTPRENLAAEMQQWVIEVFKMMNPFRKHGVFEGWFPYDPPAWTMAIEFKGSMLVFISIAAFSFAPTRYMLPLFLLTGIIMLATYQWSMACFMGGVVLALNDLEGFDHILLGYLPTRVRSIFHHILFFIGWFFVGQPSGPRGDPEPSAGSWGWSFLTTLIPSVYYNNEYWRFYNSIGATMLLYGVLRIRWLERFFSSPTPMYLGRHAFSLYLIHIPFEWTFGDRVYRFFGVIRQEFSTVFDNQFPLPDYGPLGLSSGFLISQLIILPANLFLAKIGTRFLDRPSVTSGRWLVAKLGLSKDSGSNSRSFHK